MQDAVTDDLQKLRQAQLLELKKRQLLKQILAPDAYERMSNIRSANPELFEQLATLLLYLYQNGQINQKISGEQLKKFIAQMLAKQTRETTITRVNK